jgi:uncharacterized phiE125 gp8 family phage protein
MTLKLITAPSTFPVTRAQAKLQCRIDSDITADDTRMDDLISAATEAAEHELQRAIMPQTWERVLDAFPATADGAIELGMPAVTSITSVTYVDENEVSQTLASSAYSHDTDTQEGIWLLPAIDTDWPDTLDTANAVRVRFACGYANADAVPDTVKTWILLWIEHAYLRKEMPAWAARLLDRYRVYA